jgi:hypothetical protein
MKRSEMIAVADGLYEQRTAEGMDHFSICVIDSTAKRIAARMKILLMPQYDIEWFLIRSGAAQAVQSGKVLNRIVAAPNRGYVAKR